jgi:hypothetical protein
VEHLSNPFRASEIVGWFRLHYPDVKEQSLRAHIQGATSNASAESRGMLANKQPLITRIEHGLYRRYGGDPDPAQPQSDCQRGRAVAPRSREVAAHQDGRRRKDAPR